MSHPVGSGDSGLVPFPMHAWYPSGLPGSLSVGESARHPDALKWLFGVHIIRYCVVGLSGAEFDLETGTESTGATSLLALRLGASDEPRARGASSSGDGSLSSTAKYPDSMLDETDETAQSRG